MAIEVCMRIGFYLLSFCLLLLLGGCSQEYEAIGNPKATKYTSAARQRATMHSYHVLGRKYYPTYVEVGQVMQGISSWYGPHFHGKQTSNGEIYNMYGHTAAHKTWPMDTMVKVRNKSNGKSTIVRINDRGPFVSGRIIDCSYAAGKAIGLDHAGIAQVSLEVVGFAGQVESKERIKEAIRTHTQTRVTLFDFGVQIGAFKSREGAYKMKKKYLCCYGKYRPIIKEFNTEDALPLYRVWLMGFGSEQEARDFKNSQDLVGAFIIRN